MFTARYGLDLIFRVNVGVPRVQRAVLSVLRVKNHGRGCIRCQDSALVCGSSLVRSLSRWLAWNSFGHYPLWIWNAMDKPLKVSTRLVMRRRYFRKGSNDNAASKRGGGNGCGSTIGERWGRREKKWVVGGEFLVRISFLARRGSRYVRFKTVSVLRESVRSTFAVRKYSGFMYSAKLSRCLDGMETRVSVWIVESF